MIFYVRDCQIRTARNESRYLSLCVNLGAKGGFGERQAIMWGAEQAISAGQVPGPGDLVVAAIREETYQGRSQLIIISMEILRGEERQAQIADFEPPCPIDSMDYVRRLDELISQTQENGICGKLLRMCLGDSGRYRTLFEHAPAACHHHQHYPCGLLEHSVHVAELALKMAAVYSGALTLNEDVLTSAGLLHDLGKLQTYCFSPMAQSTEQRNWTEHLTLSYAMIEQMASQEDNLTGGRLDELNKLRNCILAHHGQFEYGSPVEPACLEALIISLADRLDARVAKAAQLGRETLRKNPEARWIAHQQWPGGFFIGDWRQEADMVAATG